MGLTSTFAEPFYTGGATTSLVPGIYDVAIDGRGYMLDLASGNFRHASIPLVRQQADASDTPGEQSLNPEDLWRRSVDTWHRGAGQTYLDAKDSEEGMFRTSKGIDPWTQGQVSLLPDTSLKSSSANATLFLAVAGGFLYVLDGTALKYTNDITVGSPSFTTVTGTAFNSPASIASDGNNVWVIDDTDLYYTTRGTSTYDTWSSDTVPGDVVRYVKGRLMVASGRIVYNVLAQGEALAGELFSHPNTDWVWTDIAEGPNAIYLSGFSGDKSLIYRTAFETSLSDLDVPTVAASLPDGEIVRSMQGYLGFLLIGTDKGLRFAAPSGQGDLQLGDLIPLSNPVTCFEPQDRFVWFSWENYDADSTGLGRIDLRTLNGTQPAYATDLMAETQGEVTSVVTFQDLRVFSVGSAGIYAQSTDKVASGTVESGLVGYRLSSTKTALYLETQNRKGAGSFQAAVAADEAPFVDVGGVVTTLANEAGLSNTSVGQVAGEVFEVRHTLTRAGDATTGPTIGRFTLRADPQAPRRYKIQVPLLLHPHVVTPGGSTENIDVTTERSILTALASTRRPVAYQEGITQYTVIVEDFEWVADKSGRFPAYEFAGTLNTILKTV